MKLSNLTYRQILAVVGLVCVVGVCVYMMVSPWLQTTISEIDITYGKRSGRGSKSVNGTAVFSEMFRQSGADVKSWNRLSPRMKRSDAIVWVPNSFELPSTAEIQYFDKEWLRIDDGRKRTLIYVARDYDAAVDYWQQQRESSTGERWITAQDSLARSQANHDYARNLTATAMTCKWFSIESLQHLMTVTPTEGAWSTDLAKEATRISVAGKLLPPDTKASANLHAQTLLGTEETPLVMQITDAYYWPHGQVIVILNGSSVLNLPLVNHENRKIAAKLVDQCDSPRRVTFLETGPAGPIISTETNQANSGFEAFTVWPISSILLHLIIAGILFCAMVFPIFGRPHDVENESLSDFGKHIQAMGELLALAGDRSAAIARVQQYRNLKIEPIGSEPEPEPNVKGNPFKVSQA